MVEEHLTETSSSFYGGFIVKEILGELTGDRATCNDKELRQKGRVGNTNEIPLHITVEQQRNNLNEGKGAKSGRLPVE